MVRRLGRFLYLQVRKMATKIIKITSISPKAMNPDIPPRETPEDLFVAFCHLPGLFLEGFLPLLLLADRLPLLTMFKSASSVVTCTDLTVLYTTDFSVEAETDRKSRKKNATLIWQSNEIGMLWTRYQSLQFKFMGPYCIIYSSALHSLLSWSSSLVITSGHKWCMWGLRGLG